MFEAAAGAFMKNVIVFTLGGQRHAVELRWVREVVTLGWVTPVPNAPPAVAGVVNYHGAIVPVIDVAVLAGAAPGPARAHPGEGAVVLEVEDTRAALRVGAVDEVTTLPVDGAGRMHDSRGRPVALLDPPALVTTLRAAAGVPEGAP
jgi:chemotaxis signal transduction protein